MKPLRKGRLFQREIARHKTVGLDTPCFIYHFEENKRYFPLTQKLFRSVEKGEARGVASVIALTEVLFYPLSRGRKSLVELYQLVFTTFPNLDLIDVDSTVAQGAAALRAEYDLSIPDALHIASAINQGATAFITNDLHLKKVKELEVILLDDF